MSIPQVKKQHYDFSQYMSKQRWSSVWHQLQSVISLAPRSVLEVGPGPGVFKTVAGNFGLTVETLDIDPALRPDYVASAEQMPFGDNCYDVVCAFQMLEHVPFERSLRIFAEMARVARSHIIVSLPDSRKAWGYSIYLPKFGDVKFLVEAPFLYQKLHFFDGQHYWEVNRRGYALKDVISEFEASCAATLEDTFRVPEFAYHRFFIFRAGSTATADVSV